MNRDGTGGGRHDQSHAATSPPPKSAPQRLALLGDPVAHSLSPVMHNAAFQAMGLAARYTALRVPPGGLAEALATAREQGFLGLNLTLPHKEAVLPLLDDVAEEARRIGAVNTVIFRDGRAYGLNTDGAGFLHSLAEDAHHDPAGKRVVVLGAGGAARAVAAALQLAGAARIDVINRTVRRAEALARDLGLPGKALAPSEGAAVLAQADLVVNCTTQGLWPAVEGLPPADPADIRPGALVADTIYTPRPTRWLTLTAARGCQTLDGLGMLVGQAVLAWQAWFGVPGPGPVMRTAAEAALQGTTAGQQG